MNGVSREKCSGGLPSPRIQRNNNVDKLKTLCAFLIICIHTPIQGIVGEYFLALTRIAVPIFLIITGFYFNPQKANKQIKKIIRLNVIANGIYFLWGLLLSAYNKNTAVFFYEKFSLKALVKLFLFNESPFEGHLWYLGAILYVLIITLCIYKCFGEKGIKFQQYLTPFLLICDLIFGKYSLLLFHSDFPLIISRNWLFVGIPYFSVGIYLHSKQKNIQTFFQRRKYLLGAIVIFSAITTILERIILVAYNINAFRDHYISTTVLSVSVFLWVLFFVPENGNFVSRIGRDDSTWIYILHPIIISFLERVNTFSNYIYDYLRPWIVFLFTLAVVECVLYLKSSVRNQKKRNKEPNSGKSI